MEGEGGGVEECYDGDGVKLSVQEVSCDADGGCGFCVGNYRRCI